MLRITITNKKDPLNKVWSQTFSDQQSLDQWLSIQKTKPFRKDQREIDAANGSFSEDDVLSERFVNHPFLKREILASSEQFNEEDVESDRFEDDGIGNTVRYVTLPEKVRYVTLDAEATYVITTDKFEKMSSIDSKTQKLISEGFVFDGKTFSLSDNAQKNWSDMKLLESMLTWPVEISTKDNQAYSLEKDQLNNFIGAALLHKKTQLDLGRRLKVAANESKNLEELNSVVDDR